MTFGSVLLSYTLSCSGSISSAHEKDGHAWAGTLSDAKTDEWRTGVSPPSFNRADWRLQIKQAHEKFSWAEHLRSKRQEESCLSEKNLFNKDACAACPCTGLMNCFTWQKDTNGLSHGKPPPHILESLLNLFGIRVLLYHRFPRILRHGYSRSFPCWEAGPDVHTDRGKVCRNSARCTSQTWRFLFFGALSLCFHADSASSLPSCIVKHGCLINCSFSTCLHDAAKFLSLVQPFGALL